MKSLILLMVMCCSLTYGQFGDLLNKAKKNLKSLTEDKNLSQDEIIKGLKEALSIGVKKGVQLCGVQNGFYGNHKIKIPFPPEAKKVERKVRSLGMDKQVDEFIVTLNRGAEKAVNKATSIFINAIKNMNIQDAKKILEGRDNAATIFLKKTTSNHLKKEFKPIIDKVLKQVEVTKYWTPIMTTYNSIPFVSKVEVDLVKYANERAIEGLFVLIAEQEKKIRRNPAERITEILKKVFGK